jgi:hypothetical protein
MNINRTLTDAQPLPMDAGEAAARWRAFRVANGYRPGRPLLTQPSENVKLAKDMVTYGLSLAQANTSGVANTCPFSTAACRAGCVSKNGGGRYRSVQAARALRVRFLLADPSAFLTLVASEIDAAYAKHGDRLRVRLNTFSDIRWEEVAPWLFTDRPAVQFYDYSKDWARQLPANYRISWSVSERTADAAAVERAADGETVAVVFTTKKGAPLPAEWHGVRVVDGDVSDNRADDPNGVVVGLRAKGRMRSDTRGMVRAV